MPPINIKITLSVTICNVGLLAKRGSTVDSIVAILPTNVNTAGVVNIYSLNFILRSIFLVTFFFVFFLLLVFPSLSFVSFISWSLSSSKYFSFFFSIFFVELGWLFPYTSKKPLWPQLISKYRPLFRFVMLGCWRGGRSTSTAALPYYPLTSIRLV